MDFDSWFRLVVAVLATWRVTHLLAREDGPAGAILAIRKRLGSGFFGHLLDCFNCLSIWVAAPVTLFVTTRPLRFAVCWLAVSGGACLLERLGPPPVIIEPLVDSEERTD